MTTASYGNTELLKLPKTAFLCSRNIVRGRSFDTLKRWQNILVRIILSRVGQGSNEN
jgi:hypothetical protein